jgi:DNA-binding SARP family transcriptional activator
VGSSNYWIDTEVLEATLVHFQPIAGADLGPDEARQVEEAVELYTGDLLEGIYADWCLYDRERLNVLYLNALGKLMAFHEVNGTYDKGLAYGQRILAHDNTREKIHRQMMRLYWLQGDRNAALAQYKQCVQILRGTFDIDPMEETKRLYEQMANNRYRLPGQIKPSTPAAKPATARIDPSVLKTARYTLNKLRQIQVTLDETSAELRHLEQLVNAVLDDSAPTDDDSNLEM